MSFTETPEQLALREAVAQLGAAYGYEYMVGKARSGGDMAELYAEAGKARCLGGDPPPEDGGAGGRGSRPGGADAALGRAAAVA